MNLSPSCPRCGYDLSGVAASWQDACPLSGRCSECGLSYQWRYVFDPLAGVPRWSIEHAPRWVTLRLPGAILRTVLAPWLWCRLRMSHPIRPGRLVALSALALLVPHLLVGVYAGWTCFAMQNWATSVAVDMHFRSPAAAFLWPYRRLSFDQYRPIVAPELWAAVALFFTFPLAFLLLPQTFATLKIRRLHLARCTAYSLMPLILWLPAVAVFRGVGILGTFRLFPFTPSRSRPGAEWIRFISLLEWGGELAVASTPWIALGAGLWLMCYWWSVARFYFRVPAPLCVVLGVGSVAVLAAFSLAAVWPGSTLLELVGNAVFGFRP